MRHVIGGTSVIQLPDEKDGRWMGTIKHRYQVRHVTAGTGLS